MYIHRKERFNPKRWFAIKRGNTLKIVDKFKIEGYEVVFDFKNLKVSTRRRKHNVQVPR